VHPGAFAEQTPHKPAVMMADGRTLSYAELERASTQLARVFRAAGLRAGDHVAFCVENRPEFFVIAWAAQRSGLYYTPCSTRLKAHELDYILNDCGAKALVATPATLATTSATSAPNVGLRLLIDDDAEGWTRFDAALSAQPSEPIADQSEGYSMLYSSGTTGRPKGVKAPLSTGGYPQPLQWRLNEVYGVTDETVFISPAPLYHAAPLGFSMLVHRCGGTAIIQERFDPEAFLQLVERHRVTCALMVPTMFVRLLKLPDEVRSRYDVSSLRVAVHGAAPCPIEVKERMIDWWGPVLHEYYSGTEGVGYVHCDSAQWLAHKGTVGRPIIVPVHILGEDGQELATGDSGTIYFEDAGFEYHGDPDQTDGSRDPLGRPWSTMGDVGYLDEDGFLYLTDRKAHTINSGGVNIYPQEAENVLVLHPDVADVAVIGIPDDEMGERVHAVVQPANGVQPSDQLGADLIAFCRERLTHMKCPRSVDFRAELPRHDTGKLYKRLLRDEYWKGRSLTGR
jgi:acyl-CoA synthetase (AMP-forming)/AMP-acid ligase II